MYLILHMKKSLLGIVLIVIISKNIFIVTIISFPTRLTISLTRICKLFTQMLIPLYLTGFHLPKWLTNRNSYLGYDQGSISQYRWLILRFFVYLFNIFKSQNIVIAVEIVTLIIVFLLNHFVTKLYQVVYFQKLIEGQKIIILRLFPTALI